MSEASQNCGKPEKPDHPVQEVGHGVLLERGEDALGYADEEGDDEGEQGKLEGERHAGEDVGQHGPPRPQGIAEIALQDLTYPLDIEDGHGLVLAEDALELLHLLGSRLDLRAHVHLEGGARYEAHEEKHY
jgi:hypothetical protein